MRVLSDGEIDIKLCQIFMKIYVYKIVYKNIVGLNGSYSTIYNQSENGDITARSIIRNLCLILLLFEFNFFLFIEDKIDNIIYTSISRDQKSHQWQCSILVTWYRLSFGDMMRTYLLYYQLSIKNKQNYSIQKQTKVSQTPLGYRCFRLVVFADHGPFKPTIFIQNLIYIDF